jgi:hypothetical protein
MQADRSRSGAVRLRRWCARALAVRPGGPLMASWLGGRAVHSGGGQRVSKDRPANNGGSPRAQHRRRRSNSSSSNTHGGFDALAGLTSNLKASDPKQADTDTQTGDTGQTSRKFSLRRPHETATRPWLAGLIPRTNMHARLRQAVCQQLQRLPVSMSGPAPCVRVCNVSRKFSAEKSRGQ